MARVSAILGHRGNMVDPNTPSAGPEFTPTLHTHYLLVKNSASENPSYRCFVVCAGLKFSFSTIRAWFVNGLVLRKLFCISSAQDFSFS
jgi:hypothetical protein